MLKSRVIKYGRGLRSARVAVKIIEFAQFLGFQLTSGISMTIGY